MDKDVGIENRLNRVLMFIKGNLHRKVTLKELAELSALSPFYLSHLFKEKYKTSPISYHNKLRIDQAVNLLKSSSKDVQTISYEFGYENPFAFSRSFKKVMGVSPKKYVICRNSYELKFNS